MLFDFFFTVRKAGVPASVKEFLTLLEALDKGVVYGSVDDFYTLSRLCLVKDEAYFDRFDLAFAAYFKGVQAIPDALVTEIPPSGCASSPSAGSPTRRRRRSRRSAAGRSCMETLQRAPRGAEGRATRAAPSGSAPRARRPSAPTATTRRASASGRRARATAAR